MRPLVAWRAYALVAAAFALLGLGHWLWAVALRGPVMYGEGAVAHAAILARDGLEYTSGARYGDVAPIFTAANYPPLYFHVAGVGDPFVTGRVLSIAATLFVAATIAWRARPAGRLVSLAIAAAWLGSVPVLQWGAALKPDLLALALTVGAVMVLTRERPMPLLAGVLIGVAAMAKPTALLPGIALAAYVARGDPLGAARGVAGGLVAAIVIASVTHGPDKAVLLHVVGWNALPWRIELLAPLVLVAVVMLAVPIVTILVTRPSTTAVTAYAAGAIGILLLGGREGATINYFLDLSAAIALAVTGRAPRLAGGSGYPIAATLQIALAVAMLNPFGIIPGRPVTTGAWGEPARIAQVREIPGVLLVEDSGLLVASGREPLVDDLFLWSRVRASGRSFREGDELLAAVREGRFDKIVSEADLQHLDDAQGYERQRWHADLVASILERYAPLGHVPGDPLFVYERRGR